MKKQDAIKKLEEAIEFVKDSNHYIVDVYVSESPDIDRVTANAEGDQVFLGLKEVGKRMDIDIHVEYVEQKDVKTEVD